MTCTEIFELVERYHSGHLPRLESEAVEQHLLSCDDCRADFRFQRTLKARLSDLPRERRPPEGTWRGIQQRLSPGRNVAGQPWWHRKDALAAAAVLLVMLTSALTTLLIRRPDNPAGSGHFTVTQAAYERAAEELGATLELRRKELSPAALAVIEQNLRIIDEAIRETQAALAADPRNAGVAALLWSSWEKKIDLLERAAQHAES